MAQLEMATLVVVLKNGQMYSANHVSIELANGYETQVSFICSGRRTTFTASDVARIDVGRRQHCTECDQRLQEIPDEMMVTTTR